MTARILFALALVCPLTAHAFGDENWPCVQRKVEHLSWGMMWTGPALPEEPEWRRDPKLAELVPLLTARGIPLTELDPALARVAEGGDARLALLFAGAFAEIDRERYRIIGGISRFAEKQRGLSDQIDAKRARLAELQATAKPDDFDAQDEIERLQDEILWDTRIYQDRQRSITYICESPVLLEKRSFAVAQAIMGHLSGD